MAHRTRVSGTNYEISGGKARVSGTGYDIIGGRTRVSGTGYDVPFVFKDRFIIYDGGSNALAGTLTLRDYNSTKQVSGSVTNKWVAGSTYAYTTSSGIYLCYSKTTSGSTYDEHTGFAYISGIDLTNYSKLKIRTNTGDWVSLGYTSSSIPTKVYDSCTSATELDISDATGVKTIVLEAYSIARINIIERIWLEE